MGLVEYTARGVEQVVKSFAEELLGRDADPGLQRSVDLDDAPVRLQRKIAAWRVFVQVLKVLGRHGALCVGTAHQTNRRIADMTSSGALRLGQWPLAFSTTN